MELFSCCLQSEADTALSIIDPFDVTVELVQSASQEDCPAGHKLEVLGPRAHCSTPGSVLGGREPSPDTDWLMGNLHLATGYVLAQTEGYR